MRFSMRQDLRLHVASTITSLALDIDCETERTGSPHTLICTKTRGAYERRCAQYALDIAHMQLLVAATTGDGRADAARADDLRQLHAAIARAFSTAARVRFGCA